MAPFEGLEMLEGHERFEMMPEGLERFEMMSEGVEEGLEGLGQPGLHSYPVSLGGSQNIFCSPLHRHSPYRDQFCYICSTPS